MFCSRCGNPDQSPETYCRQCGIFLPDPDNSPKRATPADHIRANTFLTAMSGVTSILVAAWLYMFLLSDRQVPPIVNYIVAGLLTANFAWQVQTFIRTRKLRKQLKDRGLVAGKANGAETVKTAPAMLETADFSDLVPPSVIDNTTKHLVERQERSS